MQKQKTVSYRGHGINVLEALKDHIRISVDDNDRPIAVDYRYPNGAVKRKDLTAKKFYYFKDGPKPVHDLFLQDKFSAGCAPAITITEGEEDAIASFEMHGAKWPVVSVHSSSTGLKECQAQFDFLNSFSTIYLDFDSDEPGERLYEQVAQLFPYTKVKKVIKTKFKDANDYLINNAVDEYKRIWFNARPHTPENVVSTRQQFEEILNEPTPPCVCEYPFPDLQRMTRGIRRGEFTLIKGMEGLGKTEVLGALEIHALQTTDLNIGIVHLEESTKRSLQRIATYALMAPVHLDENISAEQTMDAIEEITKRDNRIYFYKNFGSSSMNGVLNQIRWLVTVCKCEMIFLDHITRLVTGIQDIDERASLDYISTKIAQLAGELGCAIVAITHVNDDGKTRGSRNISKEAATVIDINRDHLNPDPKVRNVTNFTLEKNRWASDTGPAGRAYFDHLTFTLQAIIPEELPPLDVN